MKTLIDYIKESLLDIEGTMKANDEAIRQTIEKWINDNFDVRQLKISKNPNNDGKYEINAMDAVVTNTRIKSLTNGMFVWKEIKAYFCCSYCNNLTSLEGAPEKVGKDFDCTNCDNLISLEGAPKEVGGSFDCFHCSSLKSLEGAPEKVGGNFGCYNCKSLKSLEGAPKKIGRDFNCFNCESLTSLEGAPKEIGRDFDCSCCKSLKSKDIPATTKIKGEIYK